MSPPRMSADTQQLETKSRDAILELWGQELGVSAPELMVEADGVTLTANPQVTGVLLWRRDKDLRIAAQYQKLERIHGAIIGYSFEKIMSSEFWLRVPEYCGEPVGPAHVFYLDALPADWKSMTPRGLVVRVLTNLDAQAFEDFAETLSETERQHSGLELGPRPMWGVFKGTHLLAAAGYDPWPGRIAHVGVAVHADHRGQKLGQLAVRAAARGAISRRCIVQYRALADNAASVGLAKALHLIPYAETLYFRPPPRS
jgi:GNAT superfamily N-acetyltransferase